QPLRQRRRRGRVLRALAGRLWPWGSALRPVRYAHPPRCFHAPSVVQLPPLPAPPAPGPGVTPAVGRVRLTAWARGRVQGVGFRWWVRSRALELGLVGWAETLADGRVKGVAEGCK